MSIIDSPKIPGMSEIHIDEEGIASTVLENFIAADRRILRVGGFISASLSPRMAGLPAGTDGKNALRGASGTDAAGDLIAARQAIRSGHFAFRIGSVRHECGSHQAAARANLFRTYARTSRSRSPDKRYSATCVVAVLRPFGSALVRAYGDSRA